MVSRGSAGPRAQAAAVEASRAGRGDVCEHPAERQWQTDAVWSHGGRPQVAFSLMGEGCIEIQRVLGGGWGGLRRGRG